jgi:hypothetical protein
MSGLRSTEEAAVLEPGEAEQLPAGAELRDSVLGLAGADDSDVEVVGARHGTCSLQRHRRFDAPMERHDAVSQTVEGRPSCVRRMRVAAATARLRQYRLRGRFRDRSAGTLANRPREAIPSFGKIR